MEDKDKMKDKIKSEVVAKESTIRMETSEMTSKIRELEIELA